MTPKTRLSTLFVAEDWRRVYEAVADVDFTALDQESIRRFVVKNLQIMYPETYNDFIASAEYVTMIDTLTWLAQNTNYRLDINARENIITVAERRRSLTRLASNVAYDVKRIRPATGELKVVAVQTNQPLVDIDGNNIRGVIRWNDATDANWLDRFSTVVNAALDPNSKWGKPIRRVRSLGSEVALYRANTPSPMSGSYDISLRLASTTIPFSVWNAKLETDGTLNELGPGQVAFHMLYRADGRGFSSPTHGFMIPVKQGQMVSHDFTITEQTPNLVIECPHTNVCEGEVWLYEVDALGNAIRKWIELGQVGDGEGLGYRFNPAERAVFETLTLDQDKIAIRFGDGQTSAMPLGRFRVWYRTVTQTLRQVKAGDVKGQSITFPYVSDGRRWKLTLTADLASEMTDGGAGDSNADLRIKPSKMWRTQNRMVSGEDYNSYPLGESSILKLKAVNRTFAGYDHGLAMRDQTGVYGNISVTGADGRLFKEDVDAETTFVFDRTLESVETFIERSIAAAVKSEDKQILYADEFDPIRIDGVNFTVTSTVSERSRGKLNSPIGTGALTAFGPSSLVQTVDGERFRIDSIASETDGTGSDQVRLRSILSEDAANLAWYLPWLRRRLSESEINAVANRILLRKSFALRWSMFDATWKVIKGENVSTDPFSLENTGDITNTNADASWFIRMDFTLGPDSEEFWTMTERGRRLIFQSETSTRFVSNSSDDVIDPVTNRIVQDTVTLLGSNEARESLPRRGARTPFAKDARSGRLAFVADGQTKKFLLGSVILDTQHIYIEQEDEISLRSDWQIIRQMGNTYILFDDNLSNGESFVVVVDPTRVQMTPQRLDATGDGQQFFYNFGAGRVADHNVFAFVDGKYKSPTTDFRVYYTSLGARINFTTPAAANKAISVYALRNGQPVFLDLQFLGDGSTVEFNTRAEWPTAFVFKNGVMMNDGWTADDNVQGAFKIVFDEAPEEDDVILVKLLVDDRTFRIDTANFTATSGQLIFQWNGDYDASTDRLMIFKNGLLAHDAGFDEETQQITLANPATTGDKITAINLTVTVAESSGAEPANRITVDPDPIYLVNDLRLGVFGPLLHPDGFVDPSGIQVTDVDEAGGDRDDQTLFQRLVIEDGISDLVLWRLTTQDGHEVWAPISATTSPRGTFHSFKHVWAADETVTEDDGVAHGDIHYDTRAGKWLVADLEAEMWIEAENQAHYKWAIGRDALKFKWDHYSSDSQLIDPSPTNVHDISVLTEAHYKAILSWLDTRGEFPAPETSASLRSQFGKIERFKMLSDAIVWRPARFKILFGPEAEAPLRGRFLVTKTPGVTMSDNDLRLRVLDAIDTYFDVSNWDFGQPFLFTSLAAFVISKLNPLVQSLVIVSSSGEKFGQMFEVRCEPDELFLSTAGTAEIEIIDTLTDTRLNRR